ncbi:MAG: arginine N-succinyltransferase [Deltaproteobacteria bacterium]|nr:arginine N-succinyltransferase [Deltaproteobacteria bacterium]
MFIIRDARRSDLKGLRRLAEMLNTVNLPNEKAALEEVLDVAARSFAGSIESARDRQYLFVAEDTAEKQLVGTSMILAQHGTRESPHLYFEVIEDQRYSSTLDKHFRHLILRLGRDFDGPTEIGGLILDPALRTGTGASRLRLGKQLSYVRFLFIAIHRRFFRKRLLAELLPPLLPDGKSELWEHLGRHFTGLDYTEADHVSRKNKEFITSLFPHGEIHASLLPEHVQQLIGEVGPTTLGVKKMLVDIGFEYSHKIDPFDGGPHFEADVNNVTLLQQVKWVPFVAVDDEDAPQEISHLAAVSDPKGRHKFTAVGCAARFDLQGRAELPKSVIKALGVSARKKVYILPLDAPPPKES